MAKDLNNILLSTIEENKIKEKTPDKLPLNPTAEGWSGHEVRRFLAKSLIDSEGSFLAEFKKKMIEIKAQFEDVFGQGNGNIQGQIDSIIQNIDEVELTASSLATTVLNNHNTLNNLKVNKTLTILGIDLQDDIPLSEFKTALGDATLFANGLMSALDKQNLAQTMIDIQSLFSVKADKTYVDSKYQELDESIDTHNESETSHEDIRLLISTLNNTKLNKNLTSLVEEVNLTLSDLFVVGKGSDTRKVSLGVIASYLSTNQIQLFTVVEELPTENQNPNTIYLLVTENGEGDNQLLEYIWIEDEERFELIGSVEVDLSDYFNKTEINSMLGNKADKTSIVSKYNFINFFEGMSDFNIDTDCNEETIYLNINSLNEGTYPPDYYDGGFLIQTRDFSNEYEIQTLFSPVNGKLYTRGVIGYDEADNRLWGEWKEAYDDSKITDYVYTSDGLLLDGLNLANNIDLQNVRDTFHPEDIITISNIKIGHNIRLCINRPSGGYTEYGVATIIGLNEDETVIQTIVKKYSGSLLNSESQFLTIGTIIKHPDYPNNIYVNTTAGHFSLSNFETALTANVIRPLLTDLDLQDDILIDEFRTALGNATQSVAGLLSAEDKAHLDVLVALLENSDGNNVVDTIGEILAIFQNYPEGADLVTALSGKVDKVTGKGLSTNDYTTTEKNKLAGIASGAEVNVQSDWDAISGDALILNKPSIPTKVSDLTNDTGYITGYTETDPIFTAWNKSTGISITKSQVSDFSHTHVKEDIVDFAHNHDDRYYTEGEINTLLNAKLNSSLKGSVNGLAELGADGKVPSSQLPSYVDDVLEYTSFSNFPSTGESSKIYISQDTNKTYRWGGSGYIEISASLALGETSSTAGRGDWTKTAHDHTLLTNNPHGVTTTQIGAEPAFSKNTAFNKNFGTTAGTVAQGNHLHTGVYEPANANIQSHIGSTSNPHGVTKAQVGLGNVDNTSDLNKPISTATQSALDNKVDKVSGKGLSTNDLTNTLKTNYDNAYNHSQSTHAPSNAQKNSDITKAEIEAKLIGTITSHSHALPAHTHTKSQITDFPTSFPPTAHSTSLLTSGTLGIARGGTGRTDGYAVGVVETRASVLTKIWTGTQAQYDAIGTKDANTLYFII